MARAVAARVRAVKTREACMVAGGFLDKSPWVCDIVLVLCSYWELLTVQIERVVGLLLYSYLSGSP